MTLNYGVRYDYYAPLTEANNLIVKLNIDTGVIDPNTTPLYSSKKSNFQPRVSLAYAPGKTVFKTGFGIFVGPGQTEDQIQPVESDRVSSTISNSAYPIDPALLNAAFINSPNTRSYQPRAYANDYTIPERVYQYTGVGSAGTAGTHVGDAPPTSAARVTTCSCAASRTRSSASTRTRTRRTRPSSSGSGRS